MGSCCLQPVHCFLCLVFRVDRHHRTLFRAKLMVRFILKSLIRSYFLDSCCLQPARCFLCPCFRVDRHRLLFSGGDQRGNQGKGNKGRAGDSRSPRNSCESETENEPDHELCAKEEVVDHVIVDPVRRHNTTTSLRSRPTNTQIARDGVGGQNNATLVQSIKRAMARLDTNLLIAGPTIPFSSDHIVADLVLFRNNNEPAFYVYYDAREAKDAARRAFGPRCVNCAEDTHFARDCPAPYMNKSRIIHQRWGREPIQR